MAMGMPTFRRTQRERGLSCDSRVRCADSLTTIIVTAEEPELRVPDSNHHDALLLIDKLNFEKLAIGKFQLDLSTGFVWVRELRS